MKSFNSKNQKGFKNNQSTKFLPYGGRLGRGLSLLFLAVALMVSGNVWGEDVVMYEYNDEREKKDTKGGTELFVYSFTNNYPISKIAFAVWHSATSSDQTVSVRYKSPNTTNYTQCGTINAGKGNSVSYDYVNRDVSNISGDAINANSIQLYITTTTSIKKSWRVKNFKVYYSQFSLSFNGNGGSTPNAKTVILNNTYGDLPTPTRTGYTFNGWYTAASGGDPVTASTKVTTAADHTIHAQWTANKYTVSFNKHGGTGTANDITVTFASAYGTLPTLTPPTGYTFKGWYTAETGGTKIESGSTVSTASNHILHAQWSPASYTVTLNDNGGSGGSGSVTATYTQTMPSATAPTRSGYAFQGYFDAQTGGTKYYNADMSSAKNWDKTSAATLYARWQGYTITFNANGGTGTVDSHHLGLNDSYTLPANGFTAPASHTVTFNTDGGNTISPASVTGLEFNGWEDHGSIIDKYGDTWTYDKFDAPFYANNYGDLYTAFGYNKLSLVNHYSVQTVHGSETRICLGYNRGVYPIGGVVSQLSTEIGATVPLYAQWKGTLTLPKPTKADNAFKGWYDGETFVGNGGQTVIITRSVTLTAHWTPSYKVLYDGNGATSGSIEGQMLDFDVAYTLPSTGLSRQHTVTYAGQGSWTAKTDNVSATFQGWEDCGQYKHTNKDGSTTIFCAVPGSGVDSLFDAPRYGTKGSDVRTNSMYGSGVYDKDLLYQHYLDNGVKEYWGKGSAGRCPYVAGDPGYYPVKVKDASGDSVLAQIRNMTNIPGHVVTLKAHWKLPEVTLPVATRKGYIYNGWSDGEKVHKGTYEVSKTIQLTSDWTAITYQVTFDGNGATSGEMAAQTLTYDKAENLSALSFERKYTVSFAPAGGSEAAAQTSTYTFQNWKEDGKSKTYSNQQSVSNLSATQDSIVKLVAQWKSAAITLPSSSRTGYTFAGWKTEAGTVLAAGASYTPSKNETLTAQWNVHTYTVVFNGNGNTGGSMSNQDFTYDVAQNLTAIGYTKTYTITYTTPEGSVNPTSQNVNASFSGWAESAEGSVKYTNGQSVSNLTSTDNGTVDLYAKWGDASSKVTLPTPENGGKHFLGWYNGSTRVGGAGDEYTAPSSVTLTAHWEQYTPSITGTATYNLSVSAEQTADYSSTNTSATYPSANPNDDYYYTIDHSQISSITTGSSRPKEIISYDPSTKTIIALNAGTAIITFHQKATYALSAAEKSFTVVVNKHTPTFTWKASTLNTNQKIEDYFSTNNTDTKITYSSTGNATLYAGSTAYKLHVQADATAGSASLTVTQAENYYWAEHSETQPVTVTKPSNHLEMNMTSQTAWNNYMTAAMATSWSDDEIEFEYNGSSSKNRYVEFTFTGIPDKMTFSTSSDAGLQTPTWTWYQKIGSADWTQIEAKNQKKISVSATLSPDARAVKISYTGVLNAGYIADLKVTELQYFRRQNNETTTLNFGSHQQGDVPAAQSFVVEHANAGYKTTITAPDHYQISLSENGTYTKTIDYSSKSDAKTGGDKMGTITVWVKYLADEEGEHNNVSVVVHTDNGLADVTIPVTGKTVGKLKTTIVWNGKEDRQYSDSDGEVSNPFIVKDENNQVIDGAVVTYTTSNSDITSVNSSTYKFTPYCGGDVVLTASYAGDETTYAAATDLPETIHVALCEPTISWDQTFLSYTTADKGQEETLSAKVKNVDGNEMSSVSYTYSTANTAVASVKDNSKLVINEKGETNLTFEITANATDAKGRQYNTANTSKTVRVRGEGEACNSTVLSKGSLTYHTGQSDKFEISGPVNKISFKYSRNTYLGDGGTKMTINLLDANDNKLQQIFQKNYSDMGTSEASFNELDISSYTTAKYLEIQCTNGRYESNEIYINDLSISQKTYFTADKSSITASVAVNTPYSTTIKLDYSDVPVVQYSITNNSGMGFTLTPDRTPDNDCGAVGSYTFTLSGTCTKATPEQGVQETITLSTSAGDKIEISLTIKATLGQELTYDNSTGDKNWETKGNWTTGSLPNASNPVTIDKEIVINSEVECYSLDLSGTNASITIMPTGGLTVHAGGVTGLNSDNFRIKSTTESQGYFRMSPEATTAMPTATVEYATKSDVGAGNMDAKWQYFGVPTADNYSFYVDYITWVCEWNETTVGWIPLPQSKASNLEPFHGYIITGYDNQIRDFAGQLYNGDKEIVLTHTANGMKGDNVIANSYSAPIDVSKFKDTDFDGGELFEHVFYLMESGSYNNWQNNIKNKSITAADVSKPSPGQYIALPAPGAGDLGSVTTIAPMQGVYMYNGGQGNATLKLNYKKHVWSATGNLNRPMNAPERDIASVDPDTLRQRVRLSLVNTESGADILYLIEREKYTPEYDNGYDANKIIVDNMVNIYTNEQAGNMAVSAINDIDSMYIGFTNGAGDTLTMYASLIVGEPMYLLDTHTETRTLLTEGASYTFTAEPNTRDDFRFMLLKQSHSGDDPIYTGWINKDAAPDAHIWNTRDMLYVTEAGAHSHLYLYSMNGQLIDSQSFSDHTSMSIVSLPKGCYMARVGRTIYKFVR